jgi:hypothetical protein
MSLLDVIITLASRIDHCPLPDWRAFCCAWSAASLEF